MDLIIKIKKLLYSPLESSIDQTELEFRLQSINQDGKIKYNELTHIMTAN
jgi:Ca2+-binding EF-hand superfamily protein